MSFSWENASGMLLSSLHDVRWILRAVAQKSTHWKEILWNTWSHVIELKSKREKILWLFWQTLFNMSFRFCRLLLSESQNLCSTFRKDIQLWFEDWNTMLIGALPVFQWLINLTFKNILAHFSFTLSSAAPSHWFGVLNFSENIHTV